METGKAQEKLSITHMRAVAQQLSSDLFEVDIERSTYHTWAVLLDIIEDLESRMFHMLQCITDNLDMKHIKEDTVIAATHLVLKGRLARDAETNLYEVIEGTKHNTFPDSQVLDKLTISRDSGVPTAISAVLENFAADLLDTIYRGADERESTLIEPRDVMLAIHGDQDFFDTMGRHFLLGGGVESDIHPSLMSQQGGHGEHGEHGEHIYGFDRLTKPAIRRLYRRAGVKNMAGLIYEQTREYARKFLTVLLHHAYHLNTVKKSKTLDYTIFRTAAKAMGLTVFSSLDYPNHCSPMRVKGEGEEEVHEVEEEEEEPEEEEEEEEPTSILRKIQAELQRSCLVIPRNAFQYIINYQFEVLYPGKRVLIPKSAKLFAQSLLESFIIDIARKAHEVALLSGHKTVQTEYTRFVRELDPIH